MALRKKTLPLLTAASITLLSSVAAFAESSPHSSSDGTHRHPGGLFARMDKNEDGKIDRGESRSAATDLFRLMDKNKDGKITKEEQDGGPKGRHPKKGTGEHFARMDKNKDGKIERGETRMPEQRFALADANKDGKITKEELATAFEKMVLAQKAKHFAEFDANSDGKIEQSEALAHADKRFATLDANKDGSVTRDEAKKGLAGMKRHRRHSHDGCGGEGKAKGAKKGQPA